MSNKILLIEDEVLILRMYEKIFAYEGFEVISAEEGETGIQKAKAEKPSVVLLDIMMPKMDGLKVLDTLKLDPETKDIPVVMLTNLSSDTVIKEAFAKGAAGYLVKSEIVNDRIVNEVKQYIKL
jgi:CheY-like chemotaxis protein